jgi:hypothetical protein
MSSSPTPQSMLRCMDLRFALALVFAVFGILVAAAGLLNSPEETEKAAGINIGLWTGVSLLVLSAGFAVWWLVSLVESPTSHMDPNDWAVGSERGKLQMP